MNIRLLGALCALLMTIPAASQATQIFNFTGNCTDCADAAGVENWEITVALEVRTDYALGTKLMADDFVSFTYAQSNLVSDPVSIDLNQWSNAKSQLLQGVIAADAAMPSHFKLSLINGPDSLWACTELGKAVVRANAACKHTNTVRFSVFADGTWQFGAPAKDVGNGITSTGNGSTPGSSDRFVPEPMTLLLMGTALCGAGLGLRRRA